MTESAAAPARTRQGRDAAALSLVDIRRIDRTMERLAKPGDLTGRLKKPINGRIEPPPQPAIIAADPAPAVAPSLPLAPEAPQPLAAFAPAPVSAPFPRRAAPLPEPYIAPEPPAEPEIAPAPHAPAPPQPARAAPLPYDDLRGADDLIYYWDELRAGRALPFFTHLDRTRIAISWPDTVMVNYSADPTAMPQIARLSRLTGVVEFTSMVTEWILSCSRQVARLGKAMETRRAFASTSSPRSYHLLLLPFANAGGASEHVLCHLSCAD